MMKCLPPVDADIPHSNTLKEQFSGGENIRASMQSTTLQDNPVKHPMLKLASEKLLIPDDPAVMSRNIKSAGYFLGADVVGITQIPEWAFYSFSKDGKQVESNYKYAICIVVDQDYRTTNGSTLHDWIGGSPPQWSYLYSAFIASIIAGYIRRLGYNARVQHKDNYQILITPLLLFSRNRRIKPSWYRS